MYEEIWFIAAVAVGTVVLISGLMITLTCLCFKCCWKCGSDKGKIYSKLAIAVWTSVQSLQRVWTSVQSLQRVWTSVQSLQRVD